MFLKSGKQHQGLNYTVYLWYCIYFDCITIVLKVKVSVRIFHLYFI